MSEMNIFSYYSISTSSSPLRGLLISSMLGQSNETILNCEFPRSRYLLLCIDSVNVAGVLSHNSKEECFKHLIYSCLWIVQLLRYSGSCSS